MLQVFLLIFSLSLDSLMAGFSLGMSRIRIPMKYLLLLNGIGAILLFFSINFGMFFEQYIPISFTHIFSTILFIILGMEKILESIFHFIIKRELEFKIQISKIELIFRIYKNPEVSDMDLSKHITFKEAFCLGLALSLDNLAIGLGIGFMNISSIGVTLLSFVSGIFLIAIGHFLGALLGKQRKVDSSWISGVLIIILAFVK